jgi:hypothetical protein
MARHRGCSQNLKQDLLTVELSISCGGKSQSSKMELINSSTVDKLWQDIEDTVRT